MAHNIDMSNGRANMAFLGDRKDIWHKLGQGMDAGMTVEQWTAAAGLGWEAVKVPAVADIRPLNLKEPNGDLRRGVVIPNQFFLARSDTGAPLGYVSGRYQQHQPVDVMRWFERYVSVDARFALNTAGSLRGGVIIWALAQYNDSLDVNGEAHKAYLLMTTTFDGSGATINKATMTRVVCNNTLDASLADGGKSVVRTRHNTKFDAQAVSRELATIAEGFDAYKAMATAMAQSELGQNDVSAFFKAVLDIPFEAKPDEISGKKMASFDALRQAYGDTMREGTAGGTKWTALNAVTRYVDHVKHVRPNGGSVDESRVLSANFGSGAAMKAKALGLLMPDLRTMAVAA